MVKNNSVIILPIMTSRLVVCRSAETGEHQHTKMFRSLSSTHHGTIIRCIHLCANEIVGLDRDPLLDDSIESCHSISDRRFLPPESRRCLAAKPPWLLTDPFQLPMANHRWLLAIKPPTRPWPGLGSKKIKAVASRSRGGHVGPGWSKSASFPRSTCCRSNTRVITAHSQPLCHCSSELQPQTSDYSTHSQHTYRGPTPQHTRPDITAMRHGTNAIASRFAGPSI